MYTERHAIEDELRQNRNEIRELRDRNAELLKRLRDLDDRDMKSSSIDVLEHLTSSLTDVVARISEIIPHVPAQALIEHIIDKGEIDTSLVEKPVAAAPTIQQENIQQAATEEKLHIEPKKYSKEHNASVIKQIIQDNGTVNVKVIEHEFYNRTGRKYVNFGEQIRQAMEKFPSIQRAGRGKYMVQEQSINETDIETDKINPAFLAG